MTKTKPLPLPEAKTYCLPNGLKLDYLMDDSNPVLCMQLYIKTGSVHENSAQRGYAHFLEHLCFKSTLDFPHNNISRFASNLGGALNAYTDYDSTCYYLLLPAENMEEGMHILAQLSMHASFSEADVDIEKDIILEEIKQYQNDPEPDHIEWIQGNYFQKSPLKYPVLGNVKSIRNTRYSQLRSFYKRHYRPQNTFITVCGSFNPSQLLQAFTHYFASWQSTSLFHDTTQSSEPELVNSLSLQRIKAQGEDYLSFVLPELCEQHKLADALLIAIRYLAIGKASRLFKRLVEEDSLCSSVKVSSLCGVLSGASVINVSPLSRKHIPRILSVFAGEFQLLIEHGIPEPEFHLVKKDIIHSWLFSFESMENLANLVAVEETIGNLDRLYSYGKKIMDITPQQVCEAINTYWQPQHLAVFYEGSKKLLDLTLPLFQPSNTHTQDACYEPLPANFDTSFTPSLFHLSTPSPEISQIAENYYQITLSNGMKVLFRQLSQKSISGFSLSTPVSQLCETPFTRGINYFTSSLLLYNTQKRNHEALMRFGREHGFNIRVVHHLDSTGFRGKCFGENLDKALGTLAEIIHFPRFDASHLRLLTSNALDSIRRDNEYPVSYAYQKWFRMLTGKNTNLFRSCGDPMDIRRIRLAEIKQWYDGFYLPRDFTLAIVGCHSADDIAQLCNSLFGNVGLNRVFQGGLEPTEQSSNQTFTPSLQYQSSSTRLIKQYRKTDQAIIHLGGFAAPASNRQENTAFYVLAQILGGDISSRFFDVLREKYGFAYQTGFDFSSIKDLGFWNAYAFCDKQDYRACLALMQEIISDIALRGVDEDELEAAKRFLKGMNRFDLESVSYCASSISNLAALGYEPDYYLTREKRIDSITNENIIQITNKWLNPSNQYIHIMV